MTVDWRGKRRVSMYVGWMSMNWKWNPTFRIIKGNVGIARGAVSRRKSWHSMGI
jgi:hypothetical protein